MNSTEEPYSFSQGEKVFIKRELSSKKTKYRGFKMGRILKFNEEKDNYLIKPISQRRKKAKLTMKKAQIQISSKNVIKYFKMEMDDYIDLLAERKPFSYLVQSKCFYRPCCLTTMLNENNFICFTPFGKEALYTTVKIDELFIFIGQKFMIGCKEFNNEKIPSWLSKLLTKSIQPATRRRPRRNLIIEDILPDSLFTERYFNGDIKDLFNRSETNKEEEEDTD